MPLSAPFLALVATLAPTNPSAHDWNWNGSCFASSAASATATTPEIAYRQRVGDRWNETKSYLFDVRTFEEIAQLEAIQKAICRIVTKLHGRIQGETAILLVVDEGRKRVLLIAASILAARKLAQYDGGRRVPATISAIADAIHWAEEIMVEIDRRWPTR